MDVDSSPVADHVTLPSTQAQDAQLEPTLPTTSGTAAGEYVVKRKLDDFLAQASSPPPTSSPQPPSSPVYQQFEEERSASSTPGPSSYSSEAHRVYIARTAPHLLSRTPKMADSRANSTPPSARSSPSSDDDRSTPDGSHSVTPSASHQSHHVLPEGYRGPALRITDAEDIAPRPHLAPAVGSASLFNTTNFAVNRNGWRYTAAGPDSQHLPRTLFKTLETAPEGIHWCWSDRSVFTKISADAMTVSADKGFRSARTNIGVRSGEWYAEINVLPPEQLAAGVGSPGPIPGPMKDGPHVRVGWARREALLNAPVGFDGYSYGFRDKTGDKVTLSRPLPYGRPFKAGDVIGMYIKLPPERLPEDEHDPANIKRERIAIRYKGQLYFESLEYPKNREMEQLMERSRKGNSIEEALQGIDGTGVFAAPETSTSLDPTSAIGSSSNGKAVPNGTSSGLSYGNGNQTGAIGTGSAKVKNRKTPGSKEKPSGPPKPSLRPVPSLKGSKIGFFVNGEPQGIAFTDLFDYRPLRVKGFPQFRATSSTAPNNTSSSSSRPKSKASSRKTDGLSTEPVINVKPRENVFDDGALGYFPFVSMYGGARATLNPGQEGFRFPPPSDIEAALEAVSKGKQSQRGSVSEEQQMQQGGVTATSTKLKQEEGDSSASHFPSEPRWKPLSARYEQHLAEMWKYDLEDEERAQAVAAREAEEKAKRNAAAKERYAKKKESSLASEQQADSTPRQNADHAYEEETSENITTMDRDPSPYDETLKQDHILGKERVDGVGIGGDDEGLAEPSDSQVRASYPQGDHDEASPLHSPQPSSSPQQQAEMELEADVHTPPFPATQMRDDVEQNEMQIDADHTMEPKSGRPTAPGDSAHLEDQDLTKGSDHAPVLEAPIQGMGLHPSADHGVPDAEMVDESSNL